MKGTSMFEDVLGRVSNTSYYMARNHIQPMSFMESFKTSQIICKKWLVEEILNTKMNWGKVLVLGSWNSVLLYELFAEYGNVTSFDFVDNDASCHKDRDLYFEVNNLTKNYNSIIMDATQFSDHASYDLIINTSCEHMANIPAVYGPTYALQSNNYVDVPEHINCVDSARALSNANNITHRLYEGKKNRGHYVRYMTIGYFV